MTIEERARELASQNYTVCELYDDSQKGEPGYVVGHPELPGCVAEGDTLEEALEYLKDATHGYISLLLEQGLSVPKPRSQSISTDSNAKTISEEVGTEEPATVMLLRFAGLHTVWVNASSQLVTMDSWQSMAETIQTIRYNGDNLSREIEPKLIFAQ